MKKNQIKLMCISGIFTALVFVVTAYLHIPTYNGYVHVGDGFIFLAACLLPMPYSIFVGAIGAMLADLLTGFAIWAPETNRDFGKLPQISKSSTMNKFYKHKTFIENHGTKKHIDACSCCCYFDCRLLFI